MAPTTPLSSPKPGGKKFKGKQKSKRTEKNKTPTKMKVTPSPIQEKPSDPPPPTISNTMMNTPSPFASLPTLQNKVNLDEIFDFDPESYKDYMIDDEDDRKLPGKSEDAEEDELSIKTESDDSYTLSAKKPKQEEDLHTYIMKTFLPNASINERDAVKFILFKLGFRDVISFHYFHTKTAYAMYQQLGKFFVNKYSTLIIHLPIDNVNNRTTKQSNA
jgi:hypothetical protein